MLRFIWDNLAVIGIFSLVILFIISFFFRTAWGHWHTGKGRESKKLTAEEKKDLYHLYRDKRNDYEEPTP